MKSIEQMMNMFNNNKQSIKSYTYKDVELSRESLFNELIKSEAKIEVYNELSIEGIYPYMFSTEGFGDTLKNIGKKIIEFIKNLIKKFIDFCKKVWGWITGIFKKLFNIKDDIKKIKLDAKSLEDNIEIPDYKNKQDLMSHNLDFLNKFLILKDIKRDNNQELDDFNEIAKVQENDFYKEAYEKISKLSTKKINIYRSRQMIDEMFQIKTMKEAETLIRETCFERNEDVPYEKIYQIYLATKIVYQKFQKYFGLNSTIRKLSDIFPDYDFDEESKSISQEEVKKVLMNYFYNNGDDKIVTVKAKEIATEKNFNDFDQGIVSVIEKKIKEFNIQGQNLQRNIQHSLNEFQKAHEEFVERYVKGNSPSHYGDGQIHNTDRQETYLKDKDIPEDKKREQIIFNINGEYAALQGFYLFSIRLLSIYINSESFL